MACFIVPAVEAALLSIAVKLIENREKRLLSETNENAETFSVKVNKEPFSRKLKRLTGLLWGGSALLAFEHFWHGEIQPFFPFLTAVGNPSDTKAMLHEIATVGVSMSLIVTVIWGIMTFILGKMERRNSSDINALKGESALS
ncbi:MAG: hypothetical protein K6G00_01670 [Treponema sp.]|nr:hypothetical protein [Treponema sp.]